jgi:hypothetical protein
MQILFCFVLFSENIEGRVKFRYTDKVIVDDDDQLSMSVVS